MQCAWPLNKVTKLEDLMGKSEKSESTNPVSSESTKLDVTLSPVAAAAAAIPSPSRLERTPVREEADDDGFARPASVLGKLTPFHMPPMVSPLPSTPHYPYKTPDYQVDEDDLLTTDSESERTPKTPLYSKDIFPTKPIYSKDLSDLDSRSSPAANKSKTLDKVVLNLKKTAGDCWNVSSKSKSSEEKSRTPEPLPRRGRKSKNVKQLKSVETQDEPDLILPTKSPTRPEETVLQEDELKTKNLPSILPSPSPSSETSNKTEPKQTELPAEKPKIFKTFSRKPKKPTEVVIPSLSNRLSMNVGALCTVSIDLPPGQDHGVTLATNSEPKEPVVEQKKPTKFDLREIMALSQKYGSADEQFPEFKSIMKSIDKNQNTVDFVQKIQDSLMSNSSKSNGVTFHIGLRKKTIDLPSENTMNVRDSQPIKINLTSESDGIEGEVLRRAPSPIPPEDFRYKKPKRGRPKKKREEEETPPTLVPQQSSIIDPQLIQQEYVTTWQSPASLDPFEEFLNNPVAVQTFKWHLNLLMQGFENPYSYSPTIDPYIAMMLQRRQDPHFASLNLDGMLQLYAKLKQYELLSQNHQQSFYDAQQQQQPTDVPEQLYQELPQRAPTPPSINLPASPQENPTYAELQTVKNGETASEVLELHNKEPAKDDQEPKRTVIKKEILMPPSVHSNPQSVNSVSVSSVYPAPPSVLEVMSGSGQVGTGEKVVSFTFENCCVGPIYVETDKEVTAIVDLVQEKVNERKSRIERRKMPGKTRPMPRQSFYTNAATNARSTLAKDVVAYIDKAFTVKGMRENVIGRKKKNYPKRSKILKIDKVSGEILYPPDHPLYKARPTAEPQTQPQPAQQSIKVEVDDQCINSSSQDETQENQTRNANIDKILEVVCVEEDDEEEPPQQPQSPPGEPAAQSPVRKRGGRMTRNRTRASSAPKENLKISNALFQRKKPSESRGPGRPRTAQSLPKFTLHYPSKDAVQPSTTAGNSKEVKEVSWIRPHRQEQIKKFLERKQRKKERIEKILEKRKAKALGLEDSGKEKIYKGIGVTDEEALPKIRLKSLAGKLTKAQRIKGKKKVIKQCGKVVELQDSPKKKPPPPPVEPAPSDSTEMDAEKLLMQELLMIGQAAVDDAKVSHEFDLAALDELELPDHH